MRYGFDRGTLLGIVVLSIMMIGIAATSYFNTKRLRDNSVEVAHSREVIDVINTVQLDTVRLQADVRVYLVTGFEETIKPYQATAVKLRTDGSQLAKLTSHDVEHQPHLQAARQEIENGIAGFDSAVKMRGEPNGHAAIVELSRQRGTRSFADPLLETLAKMEKIERDRLALREADARESYQRAVFYGLTAAALGLTAVGLFIWLLAKSTQAKARDSERLASQRELLSSTLSSIGDAVVATDAQGVVTFLNPIAEKLTGWSQSEATGVPLEKVFRIVNETTRVPVENPAIRALEEGTIVGLANHTILIAKDGSERPIDDSAAPIKSQGKITGAVLVFRDMTEKKLVQEQLRRSEERRRLALDGAELGAWHLDPVTNELTTDQRFRTIFGIQADKLSFDQAVAAIHPDDQARVREAVIAATRPHDPVPYAVEYRVVHPDQSVHWVYAKGRPTYDKNSKLVSFDGTVAEVTDRHNEAAEREKLHREVELEQEKLADIFRHAPSFMAVLNGPTHIVERANDRYRELVGGRQLKGIPIREALPEVEGQGFFEVLDKVFHTGEPYLGTDQRVLLKRAGKLEERFVDFVYQPIRNANYAVTGILVHGIDVTERKHTEFDRARLAAIVESSEDAIVSKSLDGIIQSWNAGAERLFGYTASEAIGQPITLIIPSDRQEEERVIISRLRRGERIDHFETTRVAKDGSPVIVSLTVSPVRNSLGQVIGASKIARDISERKAIEIALKEADRKKDDFIALLAHELRNPLAPIRNGLQVMKFAGDREVRERSREMMERQLGHMVRLIDDLLDISRISRNKMELRRERIALADIVNSAVEISRPAIEDASHQLHVSIPEQPIILDADLTRLAQVFGNLLTNSAKYTTRGGQIWLTAETQGGQLMVSVRDTGIGIPQASLPKIFDMFSQVDRSIERSTGGLGIGLALVKGLVEMHGGSVTAQSEGEGKGSTFVVTLPLAAPSDLSSQPVAALKSGPGRRILVVDDNLDGVDSLALMLELTGNTVEKATDGITAVERADQFRPEIILMDIGMPKLNGLEATRLIREKEWGKNTTIIALTGWGQDSDKERTKEAGCDGHLVKPVSLEDLERLLNKPRA